MAALFLLLAILGAILVGDLVVENTAAGSATVLNYPITGYSQGLLLATAAALGFVVGLLMVGSVTLRRSRRRRRRQQRTAELELGEQLTKAERENARLREELARRDARARRMARVATAAEPNEEPVYEEARRVARLRGEPR